MRHEVQSLTGAVALAVAVVIGSGMAAASDAQETIATRMLKTGQWGGEQARLDVRAGEAAFLDLACAHGSISGPLSVAADGRVDWTGRFVQERVGPVRGERGAGGQVRERETGSEQDATPLEGQPARFQGTLAGDVLTLDVLVEGRAVVPTLTLAHGRRVRLVKCL